MARKMESVEDWLRRVSANRSMTRQEALRAMLSGAVLDMLEPVPEPVVNEKTLRRRAQRKKSKKR